MYDMEARSDKPALSRGSQGGPGGSLGILEAKRGSYLLKDVHWIDIN